MPLYMLKEAGRPPMYVGGAGFEDPQTAHLLEEDAHLHGHPSETFVPVSDSMINAILAAHEEEKGANQHPAAA